MPRVPPQETQLGSFRPGNKAIEEAIVKTAILDAARER